RLGRTREKGSHKDSCSRKTKSIIINPTHSPTGTIFARHELELIRDLSTDYNAYAITEEIYEHILYDDRKHISIASLEGMDDRTMTISGFSKTYSSTGSPVGYVIAPNKLTISV